MATPPTPETGRTPSGVPRVSVIIPAHNAESSIRTGLEDVLRQSVGDLEVIVIDDGSSDGTSIVARDTLSGGAGTTPWKILRLDGCGAAGARNHGIRAARGEFVAFLDDDDRWEPRKLELCLAKLEEERLDLVCHSERWIKANGSSRLRVYSDLFDPRVDPLVSLMRNNPFSTSAVVVRRERLMEAGLFDETLPSAEDYDLWIRLVMLPRFRVDFIDEPLGEYAVREGSESSKIDRRHDALVTIGRRYRRELQRVAGMGGLEYWVYRARTDFTSGLRYWGQGRYGKGLRLTVKGLMMWPFRLDWLVLGLKESLRAARTRWHGGSRAPRL